MKNKAKLNHDIIHPDLLVAQQSVYEPNGWVYQNLVKETESQEYGACDFELHHQRIKFRVGKITPTKIRQFVTLWKRIGTGPIQPYDVRDAVDLFVISVRSGNQLGQFIFPKAVLYEQGIVSKDGNGGKRAMRIYPSWDIAENKQAQKTQAWQLKYFFEISSAGNIDQERVKRLFLS